MASFFEKLKRGMGAEISEEKTEEKPKINPKRGVEKTKIETRSTKPRVEKKETGERVMEVEFQKSSLIKSGENKEKWFEPEGELAIDVYQTGGEIVIRSAVAGVRPENLDIIIENDILTIKGRRIKPDEDSDQEKINYFHQECYWGPFSRQVILPEEIDPSRVDAVMKEGILTIRLPKIERKKRRRVEVKI